jgi:hypothetical protein
MDDSIEGFVFGNCYLLALRTAAKESSTSYLFTSQYAGN